MAKSSKSPNSKKLHISLKKKRAIEVDRISVGHLRLVYAICVDRKLKYPKGRSHIAYIGTTKNGIDRVAQSAASRSDEVFKKSHGIESFHVRIITCTPRQKVASWKRLERALILTFRDKYGRVPKCNRQGKNSKWGKERELFRAERLITVIEDLG